MLNRFKNLRIQLKLVSGFGIAGFLLLIIGVISFVGMNQLSGHTEFIYKTNLIPVTVLSDLRANMLRRSNFIVWHILANDAATMAASEKSIAELDKTIEDLTAKYEPVIVAESERKLFEQLTGGTPAYKEARKKVLELSRNFRKDAAAELQKTELTEKLGVLYEALDGLIKENEQQAQENYVASHSLGNALSWMMIALNISAILIGIFTVWLVSKLIVENLTNVLEAAQQLQNGNLTHRSTVTAQDEIGKLATVFNQMAETLEQAAAKQAEALKAQAAEITGITNAIGKSQATIEFNLDGTIITANDNFLAAFGYQLGEVKGQHHRMFCDPAYASSGEYGAFWQKLNRGEFEVGVYRQFGKGGQGVWIQATYNPIMDANGKVYKVAEFATDITTDKNRNAEFEGKINAVGKAQAIVEFNLDGTIITANDNFLATFGYQLGEVKGQHHRMFCDPAYASSGEYAAFWQKLNRGEFEVGVYRQFGKGGQGVWIQASYNPILSASGRVYKVVQFATDMTAQKKAQADLDACMNDVQKSIGALAQNDLTHMMQGTYEGGLEKIKSSINAALGNLTATIATVRDAVESVTTGSEEITKGNEDLSQRTSQQASALEETSASMEEMTSTVKQNADNAKQANQLAIAARDTADKGGAVTKKAVEAMGEINQSSKKIADIITVIDEIAFQTNLLALNAAVEAARAGEHGRGFAVVAAEVRNLAQRSATAAKEIKGLINESIQRVTDGSELVHQSGKTLEEIVHAVKRVTDIIAEISAASQEQASGIDQVNKAILSMDQTTQQNAALVEQTTSAAQSMKEQASQLLRQVDVFKISGTRSAPPRAVPVPVVRRGGPAPRADAKEDVSPQPAGVAAGNGKDRRAKSDEFEEF